MHAPVIRSALLFAHRINCFETWFTPCNPIFSTKFKTKVSNRQVDKHTFFAYKGNFIILIVILTYAG